LYVFFLGYLDLVGVFSPSTKSQNIWSKITQRKDIINYIFSCFSYLLFHDLGKTTYKAKYLLIIHSKPNIYAKKNNYLLGYVMSVFHRRFICPRKRFAHMEH
jgi:hypothetical protein